VRPERDSARKLAWILSHRAGARAAVTYSELADLTVRAATQHALPHAGAQPPAF
jgi:hypothetical protein